MNEDGERPPSSLGDFCSGECRCSYIATGVEARAREDSRMHMVYSDFSDSSDDDDDNQMED